MCHMLENHFQTWHPLQRYAVVVPKSIWQADRDAGSGAGLKSVCWALKTQISSKYIVRPEQYAIRRHRGEKTKNLPLIFLIEICRSDMYSEICIETETIVRIRCFTLGILASTWKSSGWSLWSASIEGRPNRPTLERGFFYNSTNRYSCPKH